MYLCNVEAPNSKATHESTCTSALAKLCAKTVPAINLHALQLASNSALLIQLPSTGQSPLSKGACHESPCGCMGQELHDQLSGKIMTAIPGKT